MKVLIVKTSSMGDVIHTLPAVTDAQRAIPGISFDWAVEESFAEIPAWHPAVQRVIPVAIRRWRKNLLATLTGGELQRFRNELKREQYDVIIDAQGLVKSAWVAWQARGLRCGSLCGYDSASAREPLASLFYQKKINVTREMHAVDRIRHLFAQSLGYAVPTETGSYGLDCSKFLLADAAPSSIVFLHGTTRADKHWPDEHWCALAQQAVSAGYSVRVPWSNEIEQARAQRIAAVSPSQIEVLPRMNLHGIAQVLASTQAVVAVDTGLGHLAAALNVPGVSLYGPTSPAKVGAYGQHQRHLSTQNTTDLATLAPATVWNEMVALMTDTVSTRT